MEPIQLTDIPTVQPYLTSRRPDYRGYTKKSNYGLVEQGGSLLFCQIDYFGDMFVLEWNSFGDMEWIQFTVEGDQFEVIFEIIFYVYF